MARRLRQTMRTVPRPSSSTLSHWHRRGGLEGHPRVVRRVRLEAVGAQEQPPIVLRPAPVPPKRAPRPVFVPYEQPSEDDFLTFEQPMARQTPESGRRQRLFHRIAGATVGLGLIIVGMALWRQGEPESLAFIEPQPVSSFQQDYASVALMFGDFLRAPTHEARLTHVRHPRRVGPLMESYYEEEAKAYPLVRRILKTSGFLLGGKDFLTLRFERADFTTGGIIAERTPDGPKLDWESFVAHGSMPWGRFLDEKPHTLERLRVFVSLAEKESLLDSHDAFLIEHPSSSRVAYAYLERCEANGTISAHLKAYLMDEPRSPFILQVSHSYVGNFEFLDIVKVEQNQWIDLNEG